MLSYKDFFGTLLNHWSFPSRSPALTPGVERSQSNSGWTRSLCVLLLISAIQTAASCRIMLSAGTPPGFPQKISRQDTTQQGQAAPEAEPTLTKKQKKALLKDNFEKMKRDADQLADLAKSLQEDLNKSNENVLSLEVVDKADKIEKLAKRVKGMARGL